MRVPAVGFAVGDLNRTHEPNNAEALEQAQRSAISPEPFEGNGLSLEQIVKPIGPAVAVRERQKGESTA